MTTPPAGEPVPDLGGDLEKARQLGRTLQARAERADDGSSTQRAMLQGAKLARREAFRLLIEHYCGPGTYEEMGFGVASGSRQRLDEVVLPIRCTCRDLRPVGELAAEAGVPLDVQEARSAGFTVCDAVLGCQNALVERPEARGA